MARSFLNFSDKEFWTSSPRKIIAMVDKFNEIEVSKNPFIDSSDKQISNNNNSNTKKSKNNGMYIDEWIF